MKPPPHGTKHCHRKVPLWDGLVKLNFTSEYGPEEGVQGDEPQRGVAESIVGEATGTNRPRLGIANVCPTVAVRPGVDDRHVAARAPAACPLS